MKTKYYIYRYYKYKRFYQHGYSLQREIIKIDCETGEYNVSSRTTNSEHTYSDRVRSISYKLEPHTTFYVPSEYHYPHIPKYYR